MKVYFKKHVKDFNEVYAACDENLLGRTISNNRLQVKVSEGFYKGELIDIEEALTKLKGSSNINMIGKHIIAAAIKIGIVSSKAIIELEGIPYTMKFFV